MIRSKSLISSGNFLYRQLHHVRFCLRIDAGAQPGDHINATAGQLFNAVLSIHHLHELVKRGYTRHLHQKIQVAGFGQLTAGGAAEEASTAHTSVTEDLKNLRFMG